MAEPSLTVQEIKITFLAPPKNVSESITEKKNKEDEHNFQWRRYAVILTNKDESKSYIYKSELEPWGANQDRAQFMVAYDGATKREVPGETVDVSPSDVMKMFPKLLDGPELQPKRADAKYTDGMVEYLNGHARDYGKKYTPPEFKHLFEDAKTEQGTSYYIRYSKSNELKTPFGEEVKPKKEPMREPTPEKEPVLGSDENKYRSAVRAAKESGAFTGGFDIMERLFRKQHKKQKIRKK